MSRYRRNLTSQLASRLVGVALLLVACQPAPEQDTVETPPTGVEVASAGVSVGALPGLFSVAVNDAERFELDVPSLPGSRVRITLSDDHPSGLNIVEAVRQELAAFETLPDGVSFGQTQLVAPIGLTYMVRGRYAADDGAVEELRALVAHPWGNRLLTLAYRYPASDDTSERGGQLMELLGELEALPEETAGGEPED